MSINNILNYTMSLRHRFSLDQVAEVGSLVVFTVSMANCLVNRPNDGGTWNEVHDAGSVHKLEGGRVVAYRPLNLWYMHSLYFSPGDGNLPRVTSHRTISKSTIVYLASTTRERLNLMGFFRLFTGDAHSKSKQSRPEDPWGAEEPLPVNPVGPQMNKQRNVKKRIDYDVPDQFEGQIPDAKRARGYESEDDDPEEREGSAPLSQMVTTLLHNFPLQVFDKAPNNRHANESWCTLDPAQKLQITFDIFADATRLPNLFTSYFDYGFDADKWDKTIAAWFPTLEEYEKLASAKVKTQGIKQLSAWNEWGMLMASLPEDSRRASVKQVRQMVNKKWQWVPYFGNGRLWGTGLKTGTNVKHVGLHKGGPWIVKNPRHPRFRM